MIGDALNSLSAGSTAENQGSPRVARHYCLSPLSCLLSCYLVINLSSRLAHLISWEALPCPWSMVWLCRACTIPSAATDLQLRTFFGGDTLHRMGLSYWCLLLPPQKKKHGTGCAAQGGQGGGD